MLRSCIFLLASIVGCIATWAHSVRTVCSPDTKIKVEVTLADGITYSVYNGTELVLDACRLSLDVNGKVLGSSPRLKQATTRSVSEVKRPFLHLKYAAVPNEYNELKLQMKDD